jgi:myxalamid-type polyketide synthase MxaB
VFGQVVAPAASYLAMVLNGVSALGQTACRLGEVVFVAPLIVPEKGECTLQALLEPDGSFRVISFDSSVNSEMKAHATGRLTSPVVVSSPRVDLEEIQKRCQNSIDLQALASRIVGLEFGPSFQWIDSLWAGQRETVALLRVPQSLQSTDGYWLHPGLIDACFQVAGSSLSDAGDEVWLAFGLHSLEIARNAGGPMWWCHTRQIGESMWDIRLLDTSGATIAQIDGFEVSRAPRSVLTQQRTADWLYRIEWRPQPLHASQHPVGGDWLVVNSRHLSNELAQRLRENGNSVVIEGVDEISTLLNSSSKTWRGVVYPCGEGNGGALPAAAEAITVNVLKVVHALTRSQKRPRLYIATVGSQAVDGTEISESGLAHRPIWGFAKTLAQEYPDLQCTCVDLPPEAASEELDALSQELPAQSRETQVAYRFRQRYVARLVRHREIRKPGLLAPFRLQLADYGSPDHIRMVPLARRAPGPGEVEMEVKACAMNFRDVLVALGLLKDHYKNFLKIELAEDLRLGFDCAGIVVAVGDGVDDFKPGDEVMSSAPGSFASFLTLPRAEVVHKPAELSFETASAIPTVFLTAHYGLLQLAQLKAGERVLVHSAAGGVGQAAVQLAQAVGAEIFATASSGKWPFLKSQGIQHVMNSRTLDFADEILRLTGGVGVDVVLNSLTGPAIEKSFDALKANGRFIEIGKLGIWTAEQAAARRPHATYYSFDFDELIERDATLIHSTLGPVREWFESGRLHPLPITVFPVQDAIEAYHFLQRTRHVGKVVLSFASAEIPAVRADASYLITGGLGGLGLNLARHMVGRGAHHLVLTGRSVASSEAQKTVDQLRAAGANISVISADISNLEDVTRVIAACQAQAPLRGVVHAAGVLDDGVIDNQTAERFARVMAPKVHGAWYLHTQTQSLPLDFFVCFSSMASMVGALGQANYAAANAFLDGLAQYRRASGLPCLSINWGPWAEAGMAASLSVEGEGIKKIDIEEGLQIFDELLTAQRSGPAQIGVWHANWEILQKRLPEGYTITPPFEGGVARSAGVVAAPRVAEKDDLLQRVQGSSATERLALLESIIQKELIEVLRLDAAYNPTAAQPWADIGVDSSMMVELRNRLEAIFKVPLSVERLVRDMNTRSVASFVAERLEEAAAGNREPESVTLTKEEELEKAYQLVAQIPQAFITVEKQQGRQVLSGGRWRCDFASCNYLGLDLHPEVMAAISPAMAEWGVHPSWTRAVASPKIYDDLQRELAEFVGAPATLVFPSISLLHVGVLPILAGYDGVILKDTEAHHSLHEGCIRAQANGAEWVNFPHSDIDDLERKLARYPSGRTKIIATDGVYSMGSSHPPLVDYVRLAKTYNALVYVDDAHGFGIIGERPDPLLPYGYRGNGMVRHFGLDYVSDRIVYVAGMSKAFSSYAAFVTCFDEKMKANLEAAGPYVFSGPTCTASLASALAGLHVNSREGDEKRQYIYRLTRQFVEAVRAIGFEVDNGGYFPIVGVVMGNFDDFSAACQLLWEHDILITPAMYPAVPLERNLVRFSVTAANTAEEVDRAIRALEAVWKRIRGAKAKPASVTQMSQA